MTADSADRRAASRAGWLGSLSALACVLAVVAIIGLIRSLLAMTYLNLSYANEVDPFSKAVSYYVFVQQGAATFTAMLNVLAVATATILVGMAQLRVRLGKPAIVLFSVWCVALLLCAYFPTDNAPRIETTHGLVHQIAGASLFVSLPLAGVALARSLAAQPDWSRTARVVRGLSLGAVALALGYLVARLPDLLPWFTFPGPLDGRAISGLIQRALFLLELGMLLTLAFRLLRVSWTEIRTRKARAEVRR